MVQTNYPKPLSEYCKTLECCVAFKGTCFLYCTYHSTGEGPYWLYHTFGYKVSIKYITTVWTACSLCSDVVNFSCCLCVLFSRLHVSFLQVHINFISKSSNHPAHLSVPSSSLPSVSFLLWYLFFSSFFFLFASCGCNSAVKSYVLGLPMSRNIKKYKLLHRVFLHPFY